MHKWRVIVQIDIHTVVLFKIEVGERFIKCTAMWPTSRWKGRRNWKIFEQGMNCFSYMLIFLSAIPFWWGVWEHDFYGQSLFKERWKIPICTLLLNYNRLFWWFYQIGFAQLIELLKTRQIFDHAKKINTSKTSISSMNSHNICLAAYLKLVQLAIHLCIMPKGAVANEWWRWNDKIWLLLNQREAHLFFEW